MRMSVHRSQDAAMAQEGVRKRRYLNEQDEQRSGLRFASRRGQPESAPHAAVLADSVLSDELDL